VSATSQRTTFFRLMGYALRDRRLVRVAVILLLIATAADVSGPLLLKVFIDDHVRTGDWAPVAIGTLAAVYIALQLINAVANFAQALRFNRIAVHSVQGVRLDAFARVLDKPLNYFDRTPTGSLVSRLANDTEYLRELYVEVLGTYIQNVVRIAGIFIAMAILDWRLMLVCLVFLPCIATLMIVYRRLSTPRFARVRALLSEINARMYESIQGIQVIQLLRQEQRFAKAFGNTANDHFVARMRNLKLDAIMLRPLVDLTHMIVLGGLLFLFGYRSFDTPIAVGVIYAFVNYLGRFVEPLIEMTQRLSLFQQALVSGQRVFDMIDEPGQGAARQAPARIDHGHAKFERVGFSYDGRVPVLRDVTLDFEAGKFYGVVGHTGSGKSTLANLLLRFYDAGSGSITVDGHPLASIGLDELRRRVGIVQQDPAVFGGSIRDNIDFGRGIDATQVERAARAAGLHDFVASLPEGYETRLDERGSNLSTGQRQLLSLARTLAGQPRILILDEATAHVDTHTETAVQRALAALRGKLTLIVIAHRLSTIRSADSIYVLRHGEVVQQGRHDALVASDGVYRTLCELQALEQKSGELEFA
jgi:ABC-type multidrug transport system fused ATPase/permease subunit